MRFRSTDKRHFIYFVSIIGIGCLRYILEQKLKVPYIAMISLLWITLYGWWLQHAVQRFSQKRVRQYITLFTGLVVFFMILRLIKNDFCVHGSVIEKYVWYLYYIPIILIPVINIIALLHINLPDEAVLPKRYNWLLFFAGLLIIGVLTNDLHQFAFRFPPDLPMSEENSSHNILFYIIVAWVVVGIAAMLILTVRMCISRRAFKNLWLPAMVIAVGVLYWFSYSFSFTYIAEKHIFQRMYEIPEFYSMIWALFWESLLFSGMLPSNVGHTDFFSSSSLRAGLTDQSFTICLAAANAIRPTTEMFHSALQENNEYQDDDMLLKLRRVAGGWFYWTEDISEIRRLNAALEETEDYLTEERALIRQKTEIEAERARTLHQTQLYESIEDKIRPQLDLLEHLLWNMPEEESEFKKELARISVVFAYLKRYSNLLLQTNTEKSIPVSDLLLCLEESALSLQQMGTLCELDIQKDLFLPLETVAGLYALFEMALETELTSLSAVSVSLRQKAEGISFTMVWKNGIAPPRNHYLPYYATLRQAAAKIGAAVFSESSGTKTLRLFPGKEAADV